LLRLNGGSQNGVVLRPGRRSRRPGRGTLDCIQLLMDLLFAPSDLSVIRVAGILHTEEGILTEGVQQQSLVGEEAAFFCKQLGYGQGAGVRFGRRRIVVVDRTVGIEDAIVGGPGTLRLGTSFQGFTKVLCTLKGREW
jgi:hypothetical protein